MINTPITDAFLLTADWGEAKKFCQSLEIIINKQKNALEAADECLALIESVGHGGMPDNLTVARSIVLDALLQSELTRVAKRS